MTWATIIAMILQIVGPIIGTLLKNWLEKLFSNTQAKLQVKGEPVGNVPPEAHINTLFDTAEKQVPKVFVGRRLLLMRLRSIALKHAAKIVMNNTFDLSPHEAEELKLIATLIRKE